MSLVPISPDLQKSYRDTLLIPSAPSFIETSSPIIPVAIIAQTTTTTTAPYVKLTDGTTPVSVTTGGELFITKRMLSTGKTLFNVEAAGTGAIQNLATITAGKTGYLMSICFTGTVNGIWELNNNAGTSIILSRYLANTSIIIGNGSPIAVYTTTQIIKTTGPATGHVSITYIEE